MSRVRIIVATTNMADYRRLVNEKKTHPIQITRFLFPFHEYLCNILTSQHFKCIRVPTTQRQIKEKEVKIVPHQDGRLTAPYCVLKSPYWTMQWNERRLDALRKLIGWKKCQLHENTAPKVRGKCGGVFLVWNAKETHGILIVNRNSNVICYNCYV